MFDSQAEAGDPTGLTARLCSGILPPSHDSQHLHWDDKVPSRSSLSAPSCPIPWHWQQATQHPTEPNIPPGSSSIATDSKTVLRVDKLWSVPQPGQQRDGESILFLVPGETPAGESTVIPERERKGHGSAWYSTSKDEVHVLCPIPIPMPPPAFRALLKCQAGTVDSSDANKGRWICAFPLPPAEATQSSWAQAGELVLLHGRQ